MEHFPRRSLGTRPHRLFLVAALLSLVWLGSSVPAHAATTITAVGDLGCGTSDPDYNGGAGTASRCRQRAVSDLVVDQLPTAFLPLGDNQYANGGLADFEAVYEPTFGRANAVVYPVIGNVEYDTPSAQGYFDYYANAGVTGRIRASGADTSNYDGGHYYSFDIGDWHLIALNSNCAKVPGGCGVGSAQEAWLKRDLAAHPNRCTLAYFHHPRWNSGRLGNDTSGSAFWKALYAAGADVVLNGHGNHHYERHAPQDPTGAPDAVNGLRQFLVSTGGEGLGTPPVTPGKLDTLEVADYTSLGVLRMTLHERSYDWSFVPATGGSFTDSGSGTCHAGPAQAPAAPSLVALPGDGSIGLSWSAPSDGGASITGYKIYRGTTAGAETLLTTLENVTSYTDAAVSNGTSYSYRVAAVNRVGEGPKSAADSATPTSTPLPAFPAAPLLDGFARAPGALGDSWRSPGLTDPGTVSIATSGATASSASAGSATWSAASFAADQDVFLTVPTLPTANRFVQLAARVSTLGTSSLSGYFLRVSGTGVWDLRKRVSGASSVSIRTFSAPLAAGDTIGLRVVGSKLTAYRKPVSGSWAPVGSAADASIRAGGYVSFTLGDTTVRGGAFGGGTIASAPVPPAAPVLSATSGDRVVRLSWTVPASESPITGYNVYRSAGGGAETLLTTGDVTTYDDTAVSNGTQYAYRVAAVNGAGEGPRSATASATPTAPAGSAFPSAPVLDDFARAAGGLGASWRTPGLVDPGTVTIAAPGATRSSAGASSASWSVASFAADQDAHLRVPTLPRAGGFFQLAGRLNTLGTANVSCYFLRVTPSTGRWDLRKKVRGATSVSMATFSAPFAAGDSAGLRIRGSTLTAYRKPGSGAWSPVGSATDTAITAGGYVSFTLGDTTVRGGAFGGGPIG